ncbi:hypothetical protein [Nocardia inohanensis]|uniref:hypothetical protein n=1 Tax=Nocardia inohanensis TaxID=209246 RepID=UPI000A7389EF|nr:hypothetical protein [Nocardia inohanensis]
MPGDSSGCPLCRWQPEPLRWIGVQLMYSLYRAADHRESTLGRTSRIAEAASLISGR